MMTSAYVVIALSMLVGHASAFNMVYGSNIDSPLSNMLTSCNSTERNKYSPSFFGYTVMIQSRLKAK